MQKMNSMKKEEIRKIARKNIEDLFNGAIKSIIEKAFQIEIKYIDEYLISTHFALREKFNKVRGVGRGIVGFSELWYFLYIKKFLEKYLNIQFQVVETKNETVHNHYEGIYKGNNLILSSDISMDKNFNLKIYKNTRKRPDIFIGIRKSNKRVKPIAIFEIKLYQRNVKKIEEVVNRFKHINNILTENNIVLPFSIFLYLQHSEYRPFIKKAENEFNIQFKNFKNLSEKSMLLINRIIRWDKERYDNKIEGSIYQIMNKIISFIDESCN